MPVQRGALAVAGAAAATLAVVELIRRRRRKGHSLPPGRRGWLLVGETLDYMANPVKFIAAGLKEFGGSFRTNIMLMDTVILEPTEANFKFFTGQHSLGWPEHWKKVWGLTALPMVNNPTHKRLRTVYGRAFSQHSLDKYLGMFQEMTRRHLARWAEWPAAQDARPAIKRYTFELAQTVILGMEFPREEMSRALQLFDGTMDGMAALLPVNLPGFLFHKSMQARRELMSIYKGLIDSKRMQPPAEATCMLDHAMASGDEPTDLELLDFALTMAAAGHDTTLASMQSVLHYLSLEPDVHAELRAEVDAAWDGQAPVTRELVQKVHKLRAFALEVLRSCAPVHMMLRRLDADAQLGDWVLPAGTTVGFGARSVMDSQYPDSEKFNIKRFLDEDGHFVDKVTTDFSRLSVFGLGGRMCIGYKFALDEMCVFLLNLIRGFDFRVEEERTLNAFPFHFWRVKARFSVRRADAAVCGGG